MNLEDNNFLDRYFSGNVSKEERDAFEKRLKEDIEFRNEVNLEKELRTSLDEKKWNFIDNPDINEVEAYTTLLKDDKTKHLKESILQARLQYKSSNSKLNIRWILAVAGAACVAIFIYLSITSNTIETEEQLYTTYYDASDLPSLLVRSDIDTFNMAQLQLTFESKKYTEIINKISDELLESSNDKSTLLLYKGISYMETNNAKAAEETFNLLIDSQLLDSEKGHWYLALLYLKTENKMMARETLNNIVSLKTYNHQKATEILKALK